MDEISPSEIKEVRNEAGGLAYNMADEAALVQLAVTGCLNNTFYATADVQLKKVLELCGKVRPETVAKTAVYAREYGHMKEMPALLCAYLIRHKELITKIFSRVIDNGKMLRNFVKFIRSGETGRKALAAGLPKRLIGDWFNLRTPKDVFLQSIGNDPSFKDIIRLAHVKPLDKNKNAVYRWILGHDYVEKDLPDVMRQFEDFKAGKTKDVPNVPFEMLTSLKLEQADWCQIALRAGWHWLRMNLNTMQRHGVFDVPDMVEFVVKRLTDRDAITKAKVFPYQLMASYMNTTDVPHVVREALQDAMEIATENVEQIPGEGYVAVDVSGSMASPVTGVRRGSTTKVRCVDVAGLVGSSILRKNPSSCIIPFANEVKKHDLNPRDSVMTNASKLAGLLRGGTNCSAPLQMLNEKKAKGDWMVIVSDNESWVDSLPNHKSWNSYNSSKGGHTEFSKQWDIFKERNPNARLVCMDIQPYTTTQVQDREDILNVGGMSDIVFSIINSFCRGELAAQRWVDIVEKVEL